MFARHGAHFLPQTTQVLHLVHRGTDSLFAQVSQQVFGLFAEQQLLLQVVLASLFLNVELIATASKEVIASFAELLVQVHIFQAAESKFAPFLLEFANGVCKLVAARAFSKLANLIDHRVLLFLNHVEALSQGRISVSEAFKNLVVNRVVAVADGFDGFLRHHADSLPFSFHCLEFVKRTLGSGFHSFEFFAQSILGIQILLLRSIHFFKMSTLLFEEAVACRAETSPNFVGLALGHGTHGLPRFLELF